MFPGQEYACRSSGDCLSMLSDVLSRFFSQKRSIKYSTSIGMSSSAFAKRRNVDWEDVKPVEQILSKCACCNRSLQVTVCWPPGCAHSRELIECRPRAEFSLSCQTQPENNLRLHRQFSDFIEEDCPIFVQFEFPQVTLQSAGEGSPL